MTTDIKNSFILYSEYSEFLNELTNEEAGELIKAVFSYAKTGEVAELKGAVKMVFIMIRINLDKNAEKYEEVCERRRMAGSRGGQKKIQNSVENSNQAKQANATFATNFQAKQANATFATNFQANQADNDNEYDNENDISLSSVSSPSSLSSDYAGRVESEKLKIESGKWVNREEREKISSEDRRILEDYVRKHKLASRNVRAYVNRIIENRDHLEILEEEKRRLTKPKILTREERIKAEMEEIHDKRSAASVLYRYYVKGNSPPDEFDDLMEKYDLTTYDKLYAYSEELANARARGP